MELPGLLLLIVALLAIGQIAMAVYIFCRGSCQLATLKMLGPLGLRTLACFPEVPCATQLPSHFKEFGLLPPADSFPNDY